jgi:hypothetical protein
MKKNGTITTTAQVEFRSITNLVEFEAWAVRVNQAAAGGEFMCDLQDVFARSEMTALKEIFWAAYDKGIARMLLFGIFKCMGDDKLLEFTKYLSRRLAEGYIVQEEARLDKKYEDRVKALEEREKKVYEHDINFSDWKKAVYKKIGGMKHMIDSLGRRIDADNEKLSAYHLRLKEETARASEYQSKASRYDQIKSLLS